MIDWQPIATAPQSGLIMLGCESDPLVDRHMFFIGLGWRRDGAFWDVTCDDITFPSHWAPITSPVEGAAVCFYRRGDYTFGPGVAR